MLKAVITTYWPPLVQDEKSQMPANVSEDYRGAQCTGTFMQTSAGAYSGWRRLPGSSNYSVVVGSQLTILVHLRMQAKSGAAAAAGGE